MGFLMGDAFTEVKKLSEPVYKMPKSMQEAIPVYRISEGGIFQLEKRKENILFDKAYYLEDINYQTKDEEERMEILLGWCKLLNSMSVDFKIVIGILNRETGQVKERLIPKEREWDPYREMEAAFEQLVDYKLKEGISGNEKSLLFLLSVRRNDFESAKAFFQTLEANLQVTLHGLGSQLIPLTGIERLRCLHQIYRMGEEALFSLNWEDLVASGRNWKNEICAPALKEERSTLQIGQTHAQVLFCQNYPNSLQDGFLGKLMHVPFHLLLSLDVVPIPQMLTVKKLENAQINNEAAITREQEEKNRKKAFSSEISYPKRRKKEELEYYLEQVHSNDQKAFYLGFLVTVFGEDEKDLESNVDTIRAIGAEQSMVFEPLLFRQLAGFHTCLPAGAREVDVMRAMFTSSMAALVPFRVQEIFQVPGVFYGSNQVSKELIVVDRKKLMNPNGFVFGKTGSGKSMFTKQEIAQILYLFPRDRVLLLDPQNEYYYIVQSLGGEILDFSKEKGIHLNPWEIPAHLPEDFRKDVFITDKSTFTKTICKEALLPTPLSAIHRTIIDRSVGEFYDRLFTEKEEGKEPEDTLAILREIIGRQPEPEARELYIALEMFTKGSLNVFSHKSNVHLDNRLLCIGLDKIGRDLKRMAMLVTSEVIRSNIEYNAKEGVATWLYADEFQIITNEELGAEMFDNLYRTVRKKGGICTALTQTLSDNLLNEKIQAMVSNSEFVVLMNQSGIDRNVLRRIYEEISEEEISYVTNARVGTGLLKCGKKVVPMDATIPKKNPLYDLFTTNFHEKHEMERRERHDK